jgi:DNA-binding transcriptional LysR family regulator
VHFIHARPGTIDFPGRNTDIFPANWRDLMTDSAWDDLKLFLHVASEGGLSGAALRTGLSAPTIGRRMFALERGLGRALFVRSQQGYRLAHDGEVLLEHVRNMHKAAENIADWHRGAFTLPIVSIASDPWLAGFVADHIGAIRTRDDAYRICCKAARPGLDLTFRESDVAVVRERPETGNLAAQRSIKVRYAAYRAKDLLEGNDIRWISMSTDISFAPSEKWVFQNRESQIYTWTPGHDLLHRLIRQGAGRGVMPVFVGDADPELVREDDIIDELDHDLWIVANADDRHRPEVRSVIDRLAEILKRNEKQFSGGA